MLKGIDVSEKLNYISKYDSDKDNPTIFEIGIITNSERNLLFSGVFDRDGKPDLSKLQNRLFDILKKGISKISNLQDKAGEKKTFEKITDEVLNLLPMDVLSELTEKIMSFNFPSEQETKNS